MGVSQLLGEHVPGLPPMSTPMAVGAVRPSIYDVHTEGGGDQAQVDACGRGKGVQPHVDVHTED